MAFSSSDVSVGQSCFAIVPSATVNFAKRARALYVGVGGNITVVSPDGSTCLLSNVPQGALLPIECIRVNVAGTTASSIVGLV